MCAWHCESQWLMSSLVEPTNIVYVNTFKGNSNIAARGLPRLVCEKTAFGVENSSTPTRMQTRFQSLSIAEGEDCAATMHIWQLYSIFRDMRGWFNG